MGITQTRLRSRTLAALASPHGVDRYVEQVNPMWATVSAWTADWRDGRRRVIMATCSTD